MAEYIVVTEEQAVQFERAGVPVKVQYTVELDALAKSQAAQPPRVVRAKRKPTVMSDRKLRWTGVAYTGTKDTQVHFAYDALRELFSAKGEPQAQPRKFLNEYLAKEFLLRDKGVFSSSVINGLMAGKYLEPV